MQSQQSNILEDKLTNSMDKVHKREVSRFEIAIAYTEYVETPVVYPGSYAYCYDTGRGLGTGVFTNTKGK